MQRYPFFRCKGIPSSGAKVSLPIVNPIISYKAEAVRKAKNRKNTTPTNPAVTPLNLSYLIVNAT